MAIQSGNESGRSPGPDRRIDSSIDFPGLAETLLRRRWTIVACVLAFLALAVVLLLVISPRYTATSRIFIDPREQRIVQNEVVQQGLGGDMALVDSQIEVITSEAVLGRVIDDTGLASDPEFVPQDEGGRDPSEIALENLAEATEVTRPENTYVLEISVTTKEAAKSARLANAIASAYVADRTSSAGAAAREVSSAIHGRLAELRKQLRESEEKVAAFKREHNVSQPEGQLLGDRRLTDLSARQSEAIARVNETRARLQVMQDAMRTRGYVGTPATDTESAMGALRIRLAEANRRLAELQQVLGPRHPRVITAKGEVAQAEATIRAESERLVASARDNYKAAVETLDKINADLKAAKADSFSTNEDLIRLRELEREAQSSKVVYESFLVRAKETAQQESITARTARIIADAAVPASPSFPPRLPLLAASLLLGLFVGILVAILRDLAAGLLASRSEVALSRSEPEPELEPVAVLVPKPDSATAADKLVMVTALGDPDMARQAALDFAHGAMARDRNVLFMDLAEDAPATARGLAEIASGEVAASSAVLVAYGAGLHTLGVGRKATMDNMSREMVCEAIKSVCADYDDVVVNVGRLDTEPGLPSRIVAGLARQAVLVVKEGGPGPREKQLVEALSNDGAVSVSVVSMQPHTELYQVA